MDHNLRTHLLSQIIQPHQPTITSSDDIFMADAPTPATAPTVSNTSKTRIAIGSQKSLPDRSHQPQAQPQPKPGPERLLRTMDELDTYREWAALYKGMKARVGRSHDKAASMAVFNERKGKMGVTAEMERRFKKLYDLVQQCDKLHANDGKPKRELRSMGRVGKTEKMGAKATHGKKMGPPLLIDTDGEVDAELSV